MFLTVIVIQLLSVYAMYTYLIIICQWRYFTKQGDDKTKNLRADYTVKTVLLSSRLFFFRRMRLAFYVNACEDIIIQRLRHTQLVICCLLRHTL